MSSENEKVMRNLALYVYVQKVINVGVCLGPRAVDMGMMVAVRVGDAGTI